MSKTEKLARALKSGKTVSEKTVKFASKNSFRAAISELRNKGLNIPEAVNGKYKLAKGKKTLPGKKRYSEYTESFNPKVVHRFA